MESEVVMLDFDGVIVQSFDLSFAMHQILQPELTQQDYRQSFENNADHINEALAHQDDLQQRFWDAYTLKLPERPLAPHIADVLEQLAGIYTLIIVSSSNSTAINTYLNHHGLANHFQEILGRDIDSSKVRKIKLVLQQYKLKPTDCVMVTDTLGDIRDAKSVGVQSIATTWGYHPESILVKGKPAAVVDDADQLPGALEEFFDFSDEYD